MATLITTLRESVRYRGKSGHYSWIAHRLSGLGILGFLLIHVWDTANAHYAPHIYAWSIDVFKHPFFGIGEIVILGCVLYHSFNGARIALLDFNPSWWKYQQTSATVVWAIFLIMFVPLAVFLLIRLGGHCDLGAGCLSFPSLADYPPMPN